MPKVILLVSLLAALLVVSAGGTYAQQTVDERYTDNASGTFAELAGQSRLSYFGQKEVFENLMKHSHLSRNNGGDSMGSWWGLWEGANSSGRITAYAAFPDLMDKTKNHFWVRFDVPTENTMPDALLAHLFAKAMATTVSGGDSIEIKLPYEHPLGGCIESYTLRMRMTTGALVSNTVEDYCPAR